MVKFLITRPIAVTMSFIAILVLGAVSIGLIPVSLMPDIDIPKITVQVSAPDVSARELENSMVRTLRQQLMQLSHLDDIRSETNDGTSIITLHFNYGTKVDYVYIEVNEKIDQAMNYLPRTLERPRVIKASAGDIPVFYLNLTVRNSPFQASDSTLRHTSTCNLKSEICNLKPETCNLKSATSNLFPVSDAFVDLSSFAANIISKRLEQLPEVAMVDMSGLAKNELLIIPDLSKLDAMELSLDQLEHSIKQNNIKLGNLSIRDGQYLYDVRFESTLRNKTDIENIYLKNNGRIFQLSEVAQVVEHPQKLRGMVVSDGKQAISLAVIKQSDAQMKQLKKRLHGMVDRFRRDFPDVEFELTRDQTALLDYSISNLQQSLLTGALLAFVVMFFFLRDFKSPLLVGITIPLSLLVSLLFFHLVGLSINIISLSGLILGIGMMVDNSIIVIDNITQHWERMKGRNFRFQITDFRLGNEQSEISNLKSEICNLKPEINNLKLLTASCVSGTNEVIRPLLSSVLTTCAVFVPLIFIDGIAGALFYDQAMAVTIGLFASLLVAITILPVYYRLLYQKGSRFGSSRFLRWVNKVDYERLYEKGFSFTMRHQALIWGIVLSMLAGAVVLYAHLDKTKLPLVATDETLLRIDWGERIHVEENRDRINLLMLHLSQHLEKHTAMIGQQQFLLGQRNQGLSSEAEIYLKARSAAGLDSVVAITTDWLSAFSKNVVFRFDEADNIFNVIFPESEAPLEVRLRATTDFGPDFNDKLADAHKLVGHAAQPHAVDPIVWQNHTVLKTSAEKLLLYDVPYQNLYYKLRSSFNENNIFMISDNTDFLPVVLGSQPRTIEEIIAQSGVRNNKGQMIPVRELVERETGFGLKTIVAGKEGEYYPVPFRVKPREAEPLMQKVKGALNSQSGFEASFSGSIFSNREMVGKLALILLISLALLYFILASQFESLTLPFLVLLEVPVDLFGAFLFLKLFGGTINLMSMIGMIVMSGIVINDSILKVDTINRLRAEGLSLMRALSVAGRRRLKPILMTSLTTILALLPILFTSGFGSDLQRPLALAIIGGMTVGTVISLFFIPLGYYYLKRFQISN